MYLDFALKLLIREICLAVFLYFGGNLLKNKGTHFMKRKCKQIESIASLATMMYYHLLKVKQFLVKVATPQCWTAWFIWPKRGKDDENSMKIGPIGNER